MIVNTIIRRSWKLLMEHGDIELIHESTKTEKSPNGISRVSISNAIRTGHTSEATFEAIQSFFKAKKVQQLQFIKDNTIPVDDNN